MSLIEEQLLFNKYTSLAAACVSKYNNGRLDDDMLQEAFLGLLLAIRSYDDTHVCSFKTFAYICITNRLKTLLVSKKEHITLEEELYFEENNIVDIIPDSLTDIEKEIVYFRLSNYTLKEISLYYNVSITTIKIKYKKIINKIRAANV